MTFYQGANEKIDKNDYAKDDQFVLSLGKEENGIDVFPAGEHICYCINRIRKSIRPEKHKRKAY